MINIYLLTLNFLTQTEEMHQVSWIRGRDLFEYSVGLVWLITKFLFYRNQFPRWQNYTPLLIHRSVPHPINHVVFLGWVTQGESKRASIVSHLLFVFLLGPASNNSYPPLSKLKVTLIVKVVNISIMKWKWDRSDKSYWETSCLVFLTPELSDVIITAQFSFPVRSLSPLEATSP